MEGIYGTPEHTHVLGFSGDTLRDMRFIEDDNYPRRFARSRETSQKATIGNRSLAVLFSNMQSAQEGSSSFPCTPTMHRQV
jgi:hypothetical protein